MEKRFMEKRFMKKRFMKKINLSCLLIIFTAVFSLSSCSSTPSNSSERHVEADAPIIHSKLEGKWELIKFKKNEEDIPIVPDTEPNIIGINFGNPTDDIYPIDGFLGVNLFSNGTAFADDKKRKRDEDLTGKGFSIEEFVTTLRTGPEEHLAFEDVFKECLFYSDSYELKGKDTLILYGSERESVLTFKRIEENE